MPLRGRESAACGRVRVVRADEVVVCGRRSAVRAGSKQASGVQRALMSAWDAEGGRWKMSCGVGCACVGNGNSGCADVDAARARIATRCIM